jgi:hypothetical protein
MDLSLLYPLSHYISIASLYSSMISIVPGFKYIIIPYILSHLFLFFVFLLHNSFYILRYSIFYIVIDLYLVVVLSLDLRNIL